MEGFDVMTYRPMGLEEMEQVRRWRNSPEVASHMVTDQQIGPEEHRQWFLRTLDDPRKRYWIFSYLGQDAGVMYAWDIDPFHRRCYVGDYVGEPRLQHQKGIGAFAAYALFCTAFAELGVDKLCGEILTSNHVSLKLHTRFGFREEGVLRRQLRKGDTWHDLTLVGMFREEWEAVRGELHERLCRVAVNTLQRRGAS